uniref:Nucleolar protein of n=2 Tax=Schistocephalus solidus TaxID=70667 RepID=A0A0X3NQG5_SCHSO
MDLKLNSIVKGKVVSIKDFGAFVSIEGSVKQGLVHRSQISNHRVDDASEVLEVGEEVFCKIISKENDKIGLSMKVVNQTSGEDKDPNNVLATQLAKRRSGHGRDQIPIRLEAELNTMCSRCKGKGHMANTCFARLDEPALDLVSDPDSSPEIPAMSTLPLRKKRDSHHSKHKNNKHKHRHRSRSPSTGKEKKKRKREISSKSHKSSHKMFKDA